MAELTDESTDARDHIALPAGPTDALSAELARDGIVLVETAMLRRIIKAHRKLDGAGVQIPHDHLYHLPREALAVLSEVATVGAPIPPFSELPPHVVVVSGERAKIEAGDAAALTQLWRQIFHARIHLELDEMLAQGALSEAVVRARIERIGRIEFEEARAVLEQEHLLLPPVDDTSVYIELVALYLELRLFAPDAIAYTFPALLDLARIDETVRQDVDPDALLAASRPARAPAQPFTPHPVGPDAEAPRLEYSDPSARKSAARARTKGNRARAAILSARAGDIPTARLDLEALIERVAKALSPPEITNRVIDTTGWADALAPVAFLAASHRSLRFNAGVRLLHDLQVAAVTAEREVKVVDVVEWALSRGKLPVVRPLPATREVRVAKHLHAAAAKLAQCEVSTIEQRERLAAVLHAMTKLADDNVRATLKPKVEAALEEVALHPHSVPERVAEKKLVDELLDRAVAVGRLSLGDLRDTISHNDLKMHDLKLAELRDGDQLLRSDRLLAKSLDGVYRRAEIYMRFLQKVSSLLFGTRVGRMLTLYLMLPFLGSFAVLEGLQHMVGPLWKMIAGWQPHIASQESLLVGTGILFLLMHVGPIRRGLWHVTKIVGRVLKVILWTIPVAIWRNPLVVAIRRSIVMQWGVKPALPALIMLAVIPHGIWRWVAAGGTFLAFVALFASGFGHILEERIADGVVRGSRYVRTRAVPALVKWMLEIFEKLLDLLDRGIYRVDEYLRFRSGESKLKLVIKGFLGTIWFFITYFLRLYVDLFIEPTVNPIKHFPVVTVAAKLIIPFIPAILSGVAGPVSSVFGPAVGNAFAGFTVLVLPGLAGFLVWELKENWKLYRTTRPKTLRPQAIGHHGETMASFLRPGFHSGTLPKAYTRLRRAAWRDDERAVAKQEEVLHHAEESIARFTERQFVSMLTEVSTFRANDVALVSVTVGSNRIRIVTACPSVAPTHAVIQFELRDGELLVAMEEPGWITVLDERQQSIVETALAGFYKLSAVDQVAEWEHVTPNFGATPLYWTVWSTAWQEIARGEDPRAVIAGPTLLPATEARE